MQQKNIALVTGSSSGIGFHTSLFLARAGFYTYATMRNLDKSSKIVDIAQEDNLPLEVLRLDVTDDKSVKDVINTIALKQKRIDFVVNNAGYGSIGAVEDFSIDEIKAQFDTNFFGGHKSNTIRVAYNEKAEKWRNSKHKFYRWQDSLSIFPVLCKY